MASPARRPRVSAIRPLWATPGGRVAIEGEQLVGDDGALPEITVGTHPARIAYGSPSTVIIVIPDVGEGGRLPVRLDGAPGETAFVEVGAAVATGVHQVDSPVIDDQRQLYLTYSGTRGESSPVSVFRVSHDGFREPFVTGITNATSTACSPDGTLHVSSRFDGSVYRVDDDGRHERVASDLGVACGLAFSPDGTLYVGDRSGTVFRVSTAGHASAFASLPASVAAFHLAWGPDEGLYVTAPTLNTRDAVYRIDRTGKVETLGPTFGRPQGLAVDAGGSLYVVEALAGVCGLYRLDDDGRATRVLAGAGLVGVAFDPLGGLVVVSADTAYRLDRPLPSAAPTV